MSTFSRSRVIEPRHVFRPDDTVQILEVGAAIPWHARALGHPIMAPRSRRAAGSPEHVLLVLNKPVADPSSMISPTVI